MVDFTTILVGNKYDRPYLAKLWGYKSFNAISRGVFTPQNQKIIVLFITKEKQESLTQYEDHIDEDILHWEGEKKHGSDKRILTKQDDIHVFYRDRHHSDFTYKGKAFLNKFRLYNDRPSKFQFVLVQQKRSYADIIAEIESEYSVGETEKKAIISARKGQGLYRKKSIDLWKECSVTKFSKTNLLIASHIKPWKVSNNDERINPYNSLLLIPTLDKLFDHGYLSFNNHGNILISNKISAADYQKIHISEDLKLKIVPEKTKPFLEYHNEYVFDLINA
ncbi:HNH endonuclease [Spirochaeta cellobiosiphila]|uniref:HNH endonuclease n=1 Tax=Spirochaeta cellobiosiphila TaxID=504483 RepID=UPI0003FA97A5|nr:HNH endonuclease signature motif containing protein [Spirochaeta cellobiosiphila]